MPCFEACLWSFYMLASFLYMHKIYTRLTGEQLELVKCIQMIDISFSLNTDEGKWQWTGRVPEADACQFVFDNVPERSKVNFRVKVTHLDDNAKSSDFADSFVNVWAQTNNTLWYRSYTNYCHYWRLWITDYPWYHRGLNLQTKTWNKSKTEWRTTA